MASTMIKASLSAENAVDPAFLTSLLLKERLSAPVTFKAKGSGSQTAPKALQRTSNLPLPVFSAMSC